MKIALVHDQLREFGGAERVLVALIKIFPRANIYTSTFNKKSLGSQAENFNNCKIYQSWFGKIPVVNRLYSPLRFITPRIWESFDFSKYDLVISSSGSWMCKGIITKKPTIHISYIHHPPRYLYGYETAIEWQKYWLIKVYGNFINHFLRIWDYQSSQGPDYFIANSQETRKRINKFYRRDSTVIYPPVNIPKKLYELYKPYKLYNYYLTVSRLARAKHVDLLINAANKHKFNLKIVGTGRDEKYLKSQTGSTVEFLGNVTDNKLSEIYGNAKAFLFASVDEEFGIAPVEAMSHGLPVIAYSSGGIPEYLKDSYNGFLYKELNENSLSEQINRLEKLSTENYLKMKKEARLTAQLFSEEIFKKKIIKFVKERCRNF